MVNHFPESQPDYVSQDVFYEDQTLSNGITMFSLDFLLIWIDEDKRGKKNSSEKNHDKEAAVIVYHKWYIHTKMKFYFQNSKQGKVEHTRYL